MVDVFGFVMFKGCATKLLVFQQRVIIFEIEFSLFISLSKKSSTRMDMIEVFKGLADSDLGHIYILCIKITWVNNYLVRIFNLNITFGSSFYNKYQGLGFCYLHQPKYSSEH